MAEANPFRALLETEPAPPTNPFREAMSSPRAQSSSGRAPMSGKARSLAQGATFGWADEAEAAVRALWDRPEGDDFTTAYYLHRDRIRQELGDFREEFPGTAMAGELLGAAAVPGLGTAKVAGRAIASAPTLGGRVMRGAGIGAAEGAVFGAGVAEGPEDIAGEATLGAAAGAVLGGAVPAAIEGGRRVGGLVRGMMSPQRGADARLGQAIRRDNLTPSELARRLMDAQTDGRPATMADIGGESLRRELEVAAQSPGPAAQRAETFLSDRNRDQLRRLSNDLMSGAGVRAGAVEDVIDATMTAREQASRPLYRKAMEFQAELSEDIIEAYSRVIETPLGKQAMGKARKILNRPDFENAPLMERIDALKKGLDDVIGGAQRQGEKQIARKALQLLRNESGNGLLDLVDTANPSYRDARAVWSDGASYLGAIDDGRAILGRNVTSSQVARQFANLSDAEKEAYRIGAVDAVITRMRQESAAEPNMIKLMRSPEVRDKLKSVMEPAAAARFDRILNMEDSMFRTASQARGGSQTARRQAAMAEQEKQSRLFEGLSSIVDIVTVGIRPLFTRALPNVSRAARERLLAKQNDLIVRRLLSGDPMEAARAMRRAQSIVDSLGGSSAIDAAAIPTALTTGEQMTRPEAAQ